MRAVGVERVHRLAERVEPGQHRPAIGVHGAQPAAHRVERVAHGVAERVGRGHGVARDVEHRERGEDTVGAAVLVDAVRPLERIEPGHRRRGVVRLGDVGRAPLGIGEIGDRLARGVPGALREVVVLVVAALLPRRERVAGERAVGLIGAHGAAQRVVVEDRGDPERAERGVGVERRDAGIVRLVLLDRLRLVVEHDAAGADPARAVRGRQRRAHAIGDERAGQRILRRRQAVGGPRLLRDLLASAIGVRVALLPARRRIDAGVLLAGPRVRRARLVAGRERVAAGHRRLAARQRVAGRPRGAAGERHRDHAAERVEARLGAVAVGIDDPRRLQRAVVELRRGDVERGIGDRGRKQPVRVVGDRRRVAERIDEPDLEEELRRVVALASRRDPPLARGALIVDVAAARRGRRERPEQRRDQRVVEREVVGLVDQAVRGGVAERQRRGQVLGVVQRAAAPGQPALGRRERGDLAEPERGRGERRRHQRLRVAERVARRRGRHGQLVGHRRRRQPHAVPVGLGGLVDEGLAVVLEVRAPLLRVAGRARIADLELLGGAAGLVEVEHEVVMDAPVVDLALDRHAQHLAGVAVEHAVAARAGRGQPAQRVVAVLDVVRPRGRLDRRLVERVDLGAQGLAAQRARRLAQLRRGPRRIDLAVAEPGGRRRPVLVRVLAGHPIRAQVDAGVEPAARQGRRHVQRRVAASPPGRPRRSRGTRARPRPRTRGGSGRSSSAASPRSHRGSRPARPPAPETTAASPTARPPRDRPGRTSSTVRSGPRPTSPGRCGRGPGGAAWCRPSDRCSAAAPRHRRARAMTTPGTRCRCRGGR